MNEKGFAPWYFGEPNGDRIENCVAVWPHRLAFNDKACARDAQTFCHFEAAPYLQIRGTTICVLIS